MTRARWALPLALLLAIAASSGCVPARGPAPFVLASAPRLARRELFDLLVVRAVRGGFVPTSIEPRVGRFAVPAPSNGAFALEVQCFDDGSVGVRVLDVIVDPRTGLATVPADVRRELVGLAGALTYDAAIGPSDPGVAVGADRLDAPR